MSIISSDGASSVGLCDDRLTFSSMTQKSGGKVGDEEGVQYDSTVNGSLD